MTEERHSRESYFVAGEGVLGAPSPAPGVAVAMSMENELRAFRFSRLGPKAVRQLGGPAAARSPGR